MSARSISKASLDARFKRQQSLLGQSLPIPNPKTLVQQPWFVDPANVSGKASDGNSGDTRTLPLRTFAELFHRWGSDIPQFDGSKVGQVTVTQMSDQTPGEDAYLLTPRMVNGPNLVFTADIPLRGAPFSPTTLTAAAKTSVGTRLSLNGDLPTGTTVGDIVLNTSRTSRAVVSKVAGGNATVTQPLTDASILTVGAFVAPVEDNGWTQANTYEVHRPLTSSLQYVEPLGGFLDPTGTNGVLWLQNLHIPDLAGGSSAFTITAGGTCFFAVTCFMEPFVNVDMTDGNVGQLISCLAVNNVFLEGFAGMLAGECLSTISMTSSGNAVDFDVVCADLTIQGTNNFIENVGVTDLMIITGGGCATMAVSGGTCLLWGPGTVDPRNGGMVQNASGVTWTNCLKVATLLLDNAATGAKYVPGAPGVFTDGIAITPANLDTFTGLQNVQSGSRYFVGA